MFFLELVQYWNPMAMPALMVGKKNEVRYKKKGVPALDQNMTWSAVAVNRTRHVRECNSGGGMIAAEVAVAVAMVVAGLAVMIVTADIDGDQ